MTGDIHVNDLPEGLDKLNHPWDEVTAKAEQVIRKGAMVLQKFTCVGCGNRLTMDKFNTFYTQGSCDQCGTITDIKSTGCNYLVLYGTPEVTEVFKGVLEDT